MNVTPVHLVYAGKVQKYAKAVVADDLVFMSGFAGLDPSTGKMAEEVEAQIEVIMKKFESALTDADVSFENVVTVRIITQTNEQLDLALGVIQKYMPDLNNKAVTNYFTPHPSPLGGKVKVELLASK